MELKVKKRLSSLLVITMLLSNSCTVYGSDIAALDHNIIDKYTGMKDITTTGPIQVTTEAALKMTTPANLYIQSEYLINGGFDEGLKGWENPSWASGSKLMFTLDEISGIDDGACAKLGGNSAIEQNLRKAQPRTAYTLSVLVKGSGRIEIGAGNNKKTFTLSEEYQEISVDIWTDDNCNARIYAYVPNGAEAYVDNFNVDLKPIPTVDKGTVHIKAENQLQTFDGWGTSLVWFGNVIGGWSEENRTAISDLLFDEEKGLGFNIVRYNIGGGDAPGHDHMRPGGEMEGFATGFNGSELVYDWSADANQIQILEDALDRGVNITEAFANTPPYFMTNSGCASGSGNGWNNNLKDEYYDEFAEYLTEVVKYFKDEKGIAFDYLEPLNEPYTNYWKDHGGQEGCHFDVDKQEEIIRLTNEALKEKELTDTVVAAMDESILDTGLDNFLEFSQETKDSMEKWNVHTYGGSKRKESKNAAAMYSKDLWMSEVDLGGTGNHNPDSILPAIDLADRILYDMKHIQPTAWVIWQAVENWPNMMPEMNGRSGENSNWGLILANFEGEGVKGLEEEAYRTTKKYYSMMQYSKFIKPGSVMLQVEDDETVAFYDKENEKLVVVYMNKSNKENERVTFNLDGFNSTGASAEVYVTSGDKDCEYIGNVSISDGVLTHEAEAQSITTYVLEGVTYDDAVIKLNESTITDDNELNKFTYNEKWGYTAHEGAYVNDHVWSTTKGHTATLSFAGQRAQIYGIKASNHGIAKVTVDKGTLDEQVTTIDLYNVYREDDTCIFDTADLEVPLDEGNHTVEIEVIGNKNSAASGTAIVIDYAVISKEIREESTLNTTIKSGDKWYDTEGKRIQAHGGGMWYDEENETYYWYGEDKTYGYRPLRGVRCYSSKDLYNWEDHGLALAAVNSREEIDTNEMYKDRSEEDKAEIFRDLDKNTAVMERPKVIYNEKTDKWVMWFHADGPTEWSDANYAKAEAGVAISDSPTGPFEYIRSYRLDQDPDPSRTNQGMARDMNLFVDDDGMGYIIYSSEENGTMYISKLTDDYLDVVGWHKDGLTDEEGNPKRDEAYKGVEGEDYIRIFNGWAREAPAMFRYDGKYYLITSGCTGWAPNQAKYAMADEILGPWEEIGDPCVGDTDKTTFYSQSTYVIPVDEENGKFIYMGDRWTYSTDGQLADSRYIWLPIKFNSDGTIEIRWNDEWKLDTLDTMGKIQLVTQLPKTVEYNTMPELPITVKVMQGGIERDVNVVWNVTSNTFKKIGRVNVRGTLESGEEVMGEIDVIPNDVIYFVNCGDNTSEEYIALKDAIGENLINKEVSDQELTDVNTWGYAGTTKVNTSNAGIYEGLRYVSDEASNRQIEYAFKDLEAGTYSVYLGFYDPWAEWAGGKRKANILINGVEKQADIPIDATERTYHYADVEVDKELGIVIEPVNTGDNTDVQISWIIISQEEVEFEKSSNATLSELTVSEGALEPVFDKNTFKYAVQVGNEVEKIIVEATAEDTKATVTGIGEKGLEVGENTIQVVVTAEDGTIRIYELAVTREDEEEIPKSSNATLSELTVSKGTLEPVFDKNTFKYAVQVGNEVDKIIVEATAEDTKATVTGIGEKGLEVGENTIQVVVTAEDGTIRIYELAVTRKDEEEIPKSSNATLSELTVSKGTLEPVFDKNTFKYAVQVGNEVDKIIVEATAEDAKATVTGIGEKGLEVGENTIQVVVTAEDGKTTKSYTISVKRDGNASSGDSSNGSSTSKPATIEQSINKLSKKDKEAIINNFKQDMPYTSLSTELTLKQLKELTNNKFTDKQLQEMLDRPELLEKLGIEKAMLSNHIVLKPVKNAIFTDVSETHWASDFIKLAAELGLVAGMPDGTFEPSSSLQVADTFTFLDRVLLLNGITEMKLSRSTVERYITDKEHWAFANMASIGSKLSEDSLKIISQLGTQPITRGLLAQVLYEITDDRLKETRESISFVDIQRSPYKDGIDYCVRTGLLVGTSETTMSPDKALTRAELMAVLIRLDNLLQVSEDK